MEVKQDEMTDEQWEEMKQIAKKNICAECGADLQIHTNPESATLEVGCLNREHHGWVERETYTQALRRGKEIHPAIQGAIEKKMMPKDDLARAMNLLALRFPDAIKDPATAALFIVDCARLDLDPLIQPAEAVPIPFKSKKKKDGKVVEEKITVAMVVTADGWLSMAARGCEQDWVGPPRTMRLEEYLASLPENKGRSREEIAQTAGAIKESDCKDANAWYYLAIGRRRDGDETVVPGWFTHAEQKKATLEGGFELPSAKEPGNQARVRAIKKFIRQVFPECRQKMIAITKEWFERAEGVQAAQVFIDVEYRLITEEGGENAGTGDKHPDKAKGATEHTQLPLQQTRPPHVDKVLATAWQAAKAEFFRGRLTTKELTEYFKNNHHITVTHQDFLQEWPSSKFNAKMLSQFVDWCHSRSQS